MSTKMDLKNLPTEQLLKELEERKQTEINERNAKREHYVTLRDSTVFDLISRANTLKDALKDFKVYSFDELEAMYKLLQEHSDRHKDGKGNFTIENTEKTMRVVFKRQETTKFDERASQAERHILDFIKEEFGDDDKRSKAITKLLERKKGKIDKDNVLLLVSMEDDFNNEHWSKGIALYKESIVPDATKYYAQFFVRQNEGDEWKAIVLDYARI